MNLLFRGTEMKKILVHSPEFMNVKYFTNSSGKNGYKESEVASIQFKQVNWNEVDVSKDSNKKFIFEWRKKE